MASRELTEGRLRAATAITRWQKPERLEKVGKLSLNKINKEAGLSHSYINKFNDFVEKVAEPAIAKYNEDYDPLAEQLKSGTTENLSNTDKLRAKLKKETTLKEQYRKERDDSEVARKLLEKQISTLMFRVYELQDELRHSKVVSLSSKIQK
mgnify:FL=1